MPSNGKPQCRQKRWPACAGAALRILYNVLLVILAGCFIPWIQVLVRSIPKRRITFGPRMGWCTYAWEKQPPAARSRRIWVHALSVGEVTAAQPLVSQLLKEPDLTLFLSASTLSGYQTARRMFAGQPVRLLFFPYDWLWAVRAVAGKINPNLVVLVETDIWPNFLWEMNCNRVPVYLANIRLSDQTWSWCRRLAPAARILFAGFTHMAVQTERDHRRFIRLGIDPGKVCVTGNIKFDVPYHPRGDDAVNALNAKLGGFPGLKVIVAGSTHEGEEAALIQAFVRVKVQRPQLLLIIAPRDPGRAEGIIKQAGDHGLAANLMSEPGLADHVVPGGLIVVNRFGVLIDLYDLADLTFIGGSLVAEGGHNPLEPAACSKPVLFGPDMRDFRQIASWLVQGGAALQVKNAEELPEKMTALLSNGDLTREMGARARRIYLGHRGAVRRTLDCFHL